MSCESTKPTKIGECLQPIGYMRSVFNKKNGTPRQSSICPESKGYIELNTDIFNNPMHSVLGIQEFSHIWILYYFHLNTNKRCPSKVRPPRLNGQSCGVFASRSPHRPNPIGLSLAKLDSVSGIGLLTTLSKQELICYFIPKENSLHVSGIDILDGTPVIDIKPYIKQYDCPVESDCDNSQNESNPISDNSNQTQSKYEEKRVPEGWVAGSVVSDISVEFCDRSLQQLKKFHKLDENPCDYCLKHLNGFEDSKNAITRLLTADPRSVYRRNKCVDRLYYFTLDSIHITCWFDIETNVVEVLKIKPFLNNSNEVKESNKLRVE